MLSTVFSDRILRDAFLHDLAQWLPKQRWFSADEGSVPELRIAGWVRLADTPGRTTTFLTVSSAQGPRFAIPVTWSVVGSGSEVDPAGVISTLDTPDGRVEVSDATAIDESRKVLARALLESSHEGEGISLSSSLTPEYRHTLLSDAAAFTSSFRISAEQSNTSIVLTGASGRQYIFKLYRHLHADPNPDIELHAALQSAGNSRIAPYCGSVSLSDAAGPSDVALVNNFLPGVQDAWQVALSAAARDKCFTEQAQALGAALAAIHQDLASSLPTMPATSGRITLSIESIKQRLASSCEAVPALNAHREAIEELYSKAMFLQWPAFQRIHGDLHLGQVVDSEEQGWVFLDFEGEPLRPMNERLQADCPARDVAGVLRSLEYVAGYVQLNDEVDASQWASRARKAFLDAYLDASRGSSPVPEADMRALISVFEVDKAAYEALYEARNRPEWLPIPLNALHRLTAGQ